ncbi:MAG: superoxide dismutase family protein [Deltaproteobacteria bacterium]|nr:superoxide dismutase family protein [Deltaproteobacteria bacterium]
MKFSRFSTALIVAMSLLGVPVNAQDKKDPWAEAQTVTLNGGDMKEVGTAKLLQIPNGVLVRLALSKATPGPHAFHVHAVGKCEGPEFTTAGGHFNPMSKKHGLRSAEGSHTGDLPNVIVSDSGAVTIETVIPHVTLTAGDHTLADADGSALVLHAGADDYTTDPTGNAGGRMACGVVAPPQAAK